MTIEASADARPPASSVSSLLTSPILPTLLKLYRADKYLVKKIVASATAFFEEVRSDPKHPFSGEFDRMVLTFVDKLGSDRAYADRIDGLKRDLLARPELGDLARNIWSNTRSFIERSASGETQVLQHHLTRMFMEAGEALAGDPELGAEINQGLVAVLRSFIADQKSGVSSFISDQVKGWDMGQLISLIEINIGKDLQYIRFNRVADRRPGRFEPLHDRISAAAAVTF